MTMKLTTDLPRPIASSMPWIGNGENTSQRLNPASRMDSAAWKSAAAEGNSAPRP